MAVDGKRSSLKSSNYGIYDENISELNPPVSSEIKNGQWLGVEVKSQGEGGKVIVCAHRYTLRDVKRPGSKPYDTKRGMIGLCYVLNSDLQVPRSTKMEMGYKSVMLIREAVEGRRQDPKAGFDKPDKWGVCQLGVSVAFVGKDTSRHVGDDNIALFGAPGCFTWRGNLIAKPLGTIKPYKAAINEESLNKYLKHGLMGVAVASGHFFDDQLMYASGAPHANAVYFFSQRDGQLREEHTLTSEDYGAAFGLSLATCNVNGDASPDLIVGAPFFDDEKSQHQRGGAVYLFVSKNGKLSQKRRIKIIGKELLGQFGLSLTCMGDMNLDGYEDFAVGAPYEENGGSVYIFFGQGRYASSSVLRAEKAAVQTITSQSFKGMPLGYHLATFGSSLSGGLDMDGNGYPDLAVGAYESSKVFLFRARPIIDINTFVDDKNLRGIDPGKTGCLDDPESSDACFSFAACFKISREMGHRQKLRYRIEAEPQKPISRMYLRTADNAGLENEKNSTIKGITMIEPDIDDHQCIELIGYVGSTHLDLQTPVQFQMTYSLVQEEPSMEYNQGQDLPNLDDYPILNQAEAQRQFQATFSKDCGTDDVCKSHLVINASLRDKVKELGRTPVGEAYELELGSLEGSELLLEVEVINQMEPAYEAKLDVYFPEDLQYIGLGNNNGSDVLTADLKNATWLSVNLGNPFKCSTSLRLRFHPDPDMNKKLISLYLTANTSSEMLYDASTFVNLAIVRRAEVKLMGSGIPQVLHYGGQVFGENAFDELSQVGPPLVHKFVVINNGPSQLDVLRLHIRWPYQVENGAVDQGKWLLYLSEHPTLKNGRGFCQISTPGITANPLNLTSTLPERYISGGGGIRHDNSGHRMQAASSSPLLHQRVNRDAVWVEKVVAPRTVPNSKGGRDLQVVTLDCDRGTARCVEIRCDVYNLPVQVSATIEVRSRLWNGTLMEDYGSGIDLVEIFAKAEIKLDGDISQYIGDDFISVRTVVEADIGRQHPSLFPDWWIIIVSILAGLVVLVIISSILWKLGFFKRQRPMQAELDNDSDLMMSAHFEKVRLNSDY